MPEEYERNILIPNRRGRTGWVERREALFRGIEGTLPRGIGRMLMFLQKDLFFSTSKKLNFISLYGPFCRFVAAAVW
jgi:hypothetical protein